MPAWRRAAGYNPLATAGVILVIFFVLCAIFAPLLAPYDPAQLSLPARLQTPSHAHCSERMNLAATYSRV